ncbi:MAG: hypothetical protein K2N28_04175 [Muribaculaceae bacterium]|nr:hypothetical protein [Muribaculaceae bacterium]
MFPPHTKGKSGTRNMTIVSQTTIFQSVPPESTDLGDAVGMPATYPSADTLPSIKL